MKDAYAQEMLALLHNTELAISMNLSKISSQLEAIDEKLAFLAKDSALQHGFLEEWKQKEREAEAEASKGDVERMVEKQMAPQPHTLDHIGKDPFGTYG